MNIRRVRTCMAHHVTFASLAVAITSLCVLPDVGRAQSSASVRVPFMRVLSASGLQVVASDQTSGKIALTVRPDRRNVRQSAVSIRAILGTKEDLMRLLADPGQQDDTCVLIQQARMYPATLTRNTLSIQGAVKTNWLSRDNGATRFISTPYTLVIEEGAVNTDGAAALRIRRADLVSYLTRGLEIIIVPASNAVPKQGAVSGGEPLTVAYLKQVPCKGYLGPKSADHVAPARLASAGTAVESSIVHSIPRLESVAC